MDPTILTIIYILLGVFLFILILIAMFFLVVLIRIWRAFREVFLIFSVIGSIRKLFGRKLSEFQDYY
jgi:hypothetical protein